MYKEINPQAVLYNSKIFGNFLDVPQKEIVKCIVYVPVMHYLQQLEIVW